MVEARNKLLLSPASREFALGAIASVLAVWIAYGLLLAFPEAAARLDSDLTQALRLHVSPALTEFLHALTVVGSAKVLVPISALVFGVLSFRGRGHDAIIFAVAMLGSYALYNLLKVWIARARPMVDWAFAHETTYAFPSGHAFTAIVFWGLLVWLIAKGRSRRRERYSYALLGAAFALLTAISRIYLGVHYPTDVLAGIAGGAVWLTFCLRARRNLETHPEVRRLNQAG